MSLIKGPMSFTVYRVAPKEGVARPDAEYVAAQREKWPFRDIDPHTDVELAVGFCGFHDLDAPATDDPPDADRIAFRVDTLKVPGDKLRRETEIECKARAKMQGIEKLTKREADAVKLEVKKRLRLKVLPVSKHVHVVFGGETCRVFGTGKAADAVVNLLETVLEVHFFRYDANKLGRQASGDGPFNGLQPERFHHIAG